MSEKPILFNTEMVKAIMEGRKTVTRRIIKNKYSNANIEWFEDKYGKRLVYMQNDSPKDIIHDNGSRTCYLKSYKEILQPYDVGDILYVRETWSTQYNGVDDDNGYGAYVYKADGFELDNSEGKCSKWRPSIHMPKEAARIFLKVTNVRVERLQQIEHEDVLKEGLKASYDGWVSEWKNLWDSTIKKFDWYKYGFDANPWVWVIEFERIEKGNENNEEI